MKTHKSKKLRTIILLIISVLSALVLVVFVGLLYWMYSYANEITQRAESAFHKGKTESLLLVLDSNDFTLQFKNKSIEILGTLKDTKALPKLESLVTHQPCRHSLFVCQYELEKAILKIKGEYAATQKPFNAFLFRVTDGMTRLSYRVFSL